MSYAFTSVLFFSCSTLSLCPLSVMFFRLFLFFFFGGHCPLWLPSAFNTVFLFPSQNCTMLLMLWILVIANMFLQVRDYRNFSSEEGSAALPVDGSPIVSKICLRMSLENIVKDIPVISDNSWTYGDLMVGIIYSFHPWDIIYLCHGVVTICLLSTVGSGVSDIESLKTTTLPRSFSKFG